MRSWRGRSVSAASRRPSPGAWARSSARPPSCSPCTRRSGWRSRCWSSWRWSRLPFARHPSGRSLGLEPGSARARRAVAGISLWWVSGYDGDAFFHLAREAEAAELSTRSRCGRSTSSGTAGCIRGTPSRCGMPRSRSSRGWPESGRPRWCCTRPRCWCRCPSCSPTRPGVALPAPAGPGWRRRGSCSSPCSGWRPGHGGAYTSLALPATASRAAAPPGAAGACVCLRPRPPPGRYSPPSRRHRLAMALVHPSHSVLVAVGLAGFLVVRAILETRAATAAKSRGGARRDPCRRARRGWPVAWCRSVRETLTGNPFAGQRTVRALVAQGGGVNGRLDSPRPARRNLGQPVIAVASLARVRARARRQPAAVGRLRARRDAGDLRGRTAAVRVPALRRRGLDLAGTPDRGLCAKGFRARRRGARPRGLPALGGAAGWARGRNCAPALVSRRLRGAVRCPSTEHLRQ